MRKTRTILSLLLCLSLLLALFGCTEPVPSQPETTEHTSPATTAAPDAAKLYSQAAQPLREAKDLAVKLTTDKKVTIQNETYGQYTEQNLILTGIGTDAFAANMDEYLQIGENYEEYKEYYKDGTLYVNNFDTDFFQGDMEQEEFLARFAPVVLLDEGIYEEITVEKSAVGMTVTFREPSGPESWALPAGAKFLFARGIAELDAKGTLLSTTYVLDYSYGSTSVSVAVKAEATPGNGDAAKAPEDLSVYKKIDAIDAPRRYNEALLYIWNAGTAASSIKNTISSQAAGYACVYQRQLQYTNDAKNYIADVKTTFTETDNTLAQNTDILTEHFENNTYTFSRSGGEQQTNSSVTADSMADYVAGFYEDNMPALQYFDSMTAEDLNGLICLEMKMNAQWGKLMADYTAELLFQDGEFLNNLASAYETTESTYCMIVDPFTGFPIYTESFFSGVHIIDGVQYALAQENAQNYLLLDGETHETLTGEVYTEEAPKKMATPLLYRVTGAAGQTMYLMGTIHVGDTRTAYLPDQVYAALEASDALAVEFDVIAFEEKMEKDPEFAAQIAGLYISKDGSSVKDQLTEEQFNKAVKLLKASGNYAVGLEYMTPTFWQKAINNFFLSVGSLRAEKGMDMRLLKLAKKQQMEIRDVESALFQLEMDRNFSAELQRMLLESSLEYTVLEYCAETEETYELWCDGDEAALRAALNQEVPEMTAGEQVLYQEYMDALIIDRNEGMRKTAISYLESGDTVFFAVGLAHLLQENGLVDTLRQAGYTVEQVFYG